MPKLTIIRLPKTLKKRLDTAAEARYITRSQLVEKAVLHFLTEIPDVHDYAIPQRRRPE